MSNYIDNIKFEGDTTSYTLGLPNMYVNEKNNLVIETAMDSVTGEYLGGASKGKINIEACNDICLKPADDICFYSHHREETDEVKLKILNGENDDYPVKLSINADGVTFTTKDKHSIDKEGYREFNMNINTGHAAHDDAGDWFTKGYLKVKAQAIDLRCEEHGGIALQPKGNDSEGHMNKIKFEHGGGKGEEFFTMNTEHMSAYVTSDYRFNKNAAIKLAYRIAETRLTTDEDFDANDETTHSYYTKQTDDFYDVIDDKDVTLTWGELLENANYVKTNKTALNNAIAPSGSTPINTAEAVNNVVNANTTVKWVADNKETLSSIIEEGTLTDLEKETLSKSEDMFAYLTISYTGKKGNAIISNVGHLNSDGIGADIKIESDGNIVIGDASKITNEEEKEATIKEIIKVSKKEKIAGTLNFAVDVINNSTKEFDFGVETKATGKDDVDADAITTNIAKFDILDLAKLFDRVKTLEETVEILSVGHTITKSYALSTDTPIYDKTTLDYTAGTVNVTYKVIETINIDGKAAKTNTIEVTKEVSYDKNATDKDIIVSGTITDEYTNENVNYSITQTYNTNVTYKDVLKSEIGTTDSTAICEHTEASITEGVTIYDETGSQVLVSDLTEDVTYYTDAEHTTVAIEGTDYNLEDYDYRVCSPEGITVKVKPCNWDLSDPVDTTTVNFITSDDGVTKAGKAKVGFTEHRVVLNNSKDNDPKETTIYIPTELNIDHFDIIASAHNSSDNVASSLSIGSTETNLELINDSTDIPGDKSTNKSVTLTFKVTGKPENGKYHLLDGTTKIWANFKFYAKEIDNGDEETTYDGTHYYLGRTLPTDDLINTSETTSSIAISSFETTLGDATSDNQIFFAFPASWGTPTIVDDSNRGAGFEDASSEVNLTNYKVYVKTEGTLNGTYTITWA